MPGPSTSAVEVGNISRHGFWILIDEREFFLPFDDFPWFKDSRVASILNIERPEPDHLYWPDLDIDLTIDSIEQPDRYPLKDRATTMTPERSDH